MKSFGAALLALAALAPLALGQGLVERIHRMESTGDTRAARDLLERTVRDDPGDIEALRLQAGFLDGHGDPGARSAYERLLNVGGRAQQQAAARRLVILDLLAGDSEAARRHLQSYREAGGTGLASVASSSAASSSHEYGYTQLPGPLEPFARMAAFSPKTSPEEILPALARNVITSGYRVTASYEGLQATEYMKLIERYLSQARELQKLTDDSMNIRIEACDSAQTAELLRILGYRMRGGCGSDLILETVNATRAFLTIDSGFPLAELEQALRINRPFAQSFKSARVPVLYGEDRWLTKKDKQNYPSFIDVFLADPSLCRLYLALSKMDQPTAEALRERNPVEKLKAYAHVLDFFGGSFEIRDGVAVVPGGEKSAATWGKLTGVSVRNGAEFFERLIAMDDGWLASFYDSLRRIDGPVQEYLTEPKRLERFYRAVRGRVTSPGPARPVFRSNADLMLLTSRLWLKEDGTPHLPGNLAVWRDLYSKNNTEVYDGKLKKLAPKWDDTEDVIEALYALCRKPVENEPLRIYMALSNIDRMRSQPLAPATVARLAQSWKQYGAQYPVFTETGSLSDETILAFLDTAERIDDIGDRLLRADVAGSMQALVGLWQILVRHAVIPESRADASLAGVLAQFGKISNRPTLFDHAREGVELLFEQAGVQRGKGIQDEALKLMAGAAAPQDVETQDQLVAEMRRIFAAQKLVPLDLLFETADHLDEVAGGAQLNTALINRLSTRIGEIHPYREGLSRAEKSVISFGYWPERHLRQQRSIRLRTEVRKASGSPDRLRELRGELAGILRDTLVGLNYVHYAPPGAQLLLTNPLFVRGHDFIGVAGAAETWAEAEVYGTGWPSSAGGRLVGSLSGLAYALAQAEQNFLIPNSEQALIWGDLVPQMVLNAKVPRWWNVTPSQMHWTALHLRLARGAVAEGALSAERRAQIAGALRHRANPGRVKRVEALLASGDVRGALKHITPSELFSLGVTLEKNGSNDDPFVREIRRLAKAEPEKINPAAISAAFGSPKPKLVNSYRPDLLNLRTFPTLMGYSSRIMAESWESNVLYYAALADELYMRPSQLNVMVPQWTRQTVEAIFATHLEDWPAVLRSLREVGDQVRAARRSAPGSMQRASLDRQ